MRKRNKSLGDKALKSRAAKALSIPRLTNDYFVFARGEQLGPMTIRQLADAYWDGRINEDDQYWTSGLKEWQSILGLFHFCPRVVFPPGHEPDRSNATSRSKSIASDSERPLGHESDRSNATSSLSGFLSRPFSRKAPKVIPPKSAVVVRPEARFSHCSFCNGPFIPRFFACGGCDSGFCQVCMAEMAKELNIFKISEGCPICGGRMRVGK